MLLTQSGGARAPETRQAIVSALLENLSNPAFDHLVLFVDTGLGSTGVEVGVDSIPGQGQARGYCGRC